MVRDKTREKETKGRKGKERIEEDQVRSLDVFINTNGESDRMDSFEETTKDDPRLSKDPMILCRTVLEKFFRENGTSRARDRRRTCDDMTLFTSSDASHRFYNDAQCVSERNETERRERDSGRER